MSPRSHLFSPFLLVSFSLLCAHLAKLFSKLGVRLSSLASSSLCLFGEFRVLVGKFLGFLLELGVLIELSCCSSPRDDFRVPLGSVLHELHRFDGNIVGDGAFAMRTEVEIFRVVEVLGSNRVVTIASMVAMFVMELFH